MHGSAVVGEIKAAGSRQVDELAERGATGQIARIHARGAEGGGDGFAQFAFGGRTENQHSGAERESNGAGGLGESVRRPALGISICGAGADTDCRAIDAEGAQAREARLARRRNAIEADGGRIREVFDQAGAAQQFQVIEALVARDVAGFGPGNRAREQPAAAIARVADALWNARQPRGESRVERIRQEERRVERFLAQAGGEGAVIGEGLERGAGNDAVDAGFAGVEFSHAGPRHERDFGARAHLANHADGGQRHHGVAQPIGGAYEDALECSGVESHSRSG